MRALVTLDEDGDGPLAAVLMAGGDFTAAGYWPFSSDLNASHAARWDGRSWSALGSGLNGSVYALAIFDDDGDGPHAPALHAGGSFTLSGDLAVSNIAKWDGISWTPVGGGVDGTVRALTVFDHDGPGPDAPALYAGGFFTSAGGIPANRVARWDGSSWSALGSGLSGPAYALLALEPSQDSPFPAGLYVGGNFSNAGGVSVSNIARWSGISWSSLGVNLSGNVYALGVFDYDGAGGNPPELYAGGSFSLTFNRIAKWNGSTWSAVGSGANNDVYALKVFDEDGSGPAVPALYVGGLFTTAGGLTVNGSANWNGTTWSALGNGAGQPVYALAGFDVDGNGPGFPKLVAGQIGGQASPGYVRVWDGAAWGRIDRGMTAPSISTPSAIAALTSWDGGNLEQLYAGGAFTFAGGKPANRIARWNGADWSSLGSGLEGGPATVVVDCLGVFDDDGDGPHTSALYVGGKFAIAGGATANSIAKWDGSGWSPLSTGISGSFAEVLALAGFDEDGLGPNPPALFVGGGFTMAGGFPASRIARWSGSEWSQVGTGVEGSLPVVYALAVFDDDDAGPIQPALYVAGVFDAAGGVPVHNIARWNGSNWSPVGTGMDLGTVAALAVFDADSDGPAPAQLYAAGRFDTAGGGTVNNIARWNGLEWLPVDGGVTAGGPNGEHSGFVHAMTVFDPDGSGPQLSRLYVGGNFTLAGNVPAQRIAAWDGSSWSALDDGISAPTGSSATPEVFALAGFDEDGNGSQPPALYVGGEFALAGAFSSGRIARWGCPELPQLLGAIPPLSSPYALAQSFRDVLQNTDNALVPQGIGVAGTPSEGPYDYASISVTFLGTPSPAPDASNTAVSCTDITGNGQADCPSIASISGSGSGPYQITLSAAPPPREC
ncbi:MAG TPA: hypothetical protein VGM03_06635, partial [Phycisphaerae bacterium]